MTPRRILFLTGALHGGGSEHVLLRHALALDRSRFSPEILAIDPHTGREPYDEAGIPLSGPPARGTGYGKVFRFRRMLVKRCASGEVDLVHAWITITAVLGPQAVHAASSAPVVASQRNLGYWLDPAQRLLYRWSNRRYLDAMVVNSDAIRRRLLEERLCPEGKIHVVRNGVDLARFRPAPDRAAARAALGLPADLPLVGIVGTLKALKGQRDLLGALALLQGRGVPCQGVLVGDGPDRPALEALCRQEGLTGRVRFLGRRSDLERVYPALDVCALCSRTEGLPNVVLEAMACGCALVVTPVGGVPEVVRDGVEGLHYPAGDVPALAEALSGLLLDCDRRRGLARAGRERIEREFGWDRMQKTLEALYEAVLQGRGAPS